MIWKLVREKRKAPPNRRRFQRHAVHRMRAEVDSKTAGVRDISQTGISVEGAPSWLAPGQGISLRLLFPTPDRDILIPLEGRVLRRNGAATIVVYRDPIDNWSASFRKLIRVSDRIPV